MAVIVDQHAVLPAQTARARLRLKRNCLILLTEGYAGAGYQMESIAHLFGNDDATSLIDLDSGIHKWYFTIQIAIFPKMHRAL